MAAVGSRALACRPQCTATAAAGKQRWAPIWALEQRNSIQEQGSIRLMTQAKILSVGHTPRIKLAQELELLHPLRLRLQVPDMEMKPRRSSLGHLVVPRLLITGQRSPRPPPATLPLPAVFLDIPRARKELGMLERRPETYILERAGYATSRERTAELVKIQGL